MTFRIRRITSELCENIKKNCIRVPQHAPWEKGTKKSHLSMKVQRAGLHIYIYNISHATAQSHKPRITGNHNKVSNHEKIEEFSLLLIIDLRVSLIYTSPRSI